MNKNLEDQDVLNKIARVCTALAFLFSQSYGFVHFITRSGDKLIDGDKEFRFISVNMVEAFIIFTNYSWYIDNGMRLPDDYELEAMVKSVKDWGGRCFRAWLLPCRKHTESGWSYLNYVIINQTTNTVEFREECILFLEITI